MKCHGTQLKAVGAEQLSTLLTVQVYGRILEGQGPPYSPHTLNNVCSTTVVLDTKTHCVKFRPFAIIGGRQQLRWAYRLRGIAFAHCKYRPHIVQGVILTPR